MRILDLFCGAGGFTLGLIRSGFDVAAAVDVWQPALETYRNNFVHPCLNLDLSDVEQATRKLGDYHPDGIIGGPPCQDFSVAGRRSEGSRAMLTEAFAKIIARLQPKFFVMENVPTTAKTQTFAQAISILEQAGYTCDHVVINAALYGVPQRRKRMFCFGAANKLFAGRVIDHLSDMAADHELTVREYMGREINTDFYFVHPRTYARRAIFSIDEPAPTMRGQTRPLPSTYRLHCRDAGSIDQTRALTTYERARIQTFPPNFRWHGSKTTVNQLIGNAVPPNLATAIGAAVNLSGKPTGSNPHTTNL